MTPTPCTPLLCALLLALLWAPALGVVAPGLAQAQAPSKTQAPPNKEMVALIRQANARWEAEDWAGALALYTKAYALRPEPQLLWRLGQSSERSGDIPQAIAHYEALIQALPQAAVIPKARARITALSATLPATLRVTSIPAGANLYLDSPDTPPVGSTPATLILTPGEHTLLLKRDGYQTTRRQVELLGGKSQELEVAMQPLGARTPMDEQRLVVVEETRAPQDAFDATFWGSLTVGVGLATMVTGGVFSVLQANATDKANTYDKSGASSPGLGRREVVALQADAEDYHTVASTLYIAGGALAAAGLGVWLYGALGPGADEVETGGISFGINVDGTVKVHLQF